MWYLYSFVHRVVLVQQQHGVWYQVSWYNNSNMVSILVRVVLVQSMVSILVRAGVLCVGYALLVPSHGSAVRELTTLIARRALTPPAMSA